MTYYEVKVTLILETDLPLWDAYAFLSEKIAKAMLYDEVLKTLHGENGMKGYTFSSLYPSGKDKTFKKGSMYAFHIRTADKTVALKLKKTLPQVKQGIKIISIEIKNRAYKQIQELHSLTPAVATFDHKSWTKEDDIIALMKNMHVNALKKYRKFFGELEEPAENFIEYITMTNHKPIKIKYKNMSFLGNKFSLRIKPDEISQKLAFAVMACGLAERGSIGFGYCMAK